MGAARGKSPAQALEENAPWQPTEYDDADAAAFQALQRGTATADQQKRALDWLIRKACRTYDMSYRPGPGGERETAFAEGRRAVGNEVVKMVNVNIGNLKPRREG